MEYNLFIQRNGKLTISPSYNKIINKHEFLFNRIRELTKFLPEHVSTYERLYCILHNISESPTCGYCSNLIQFSQGKKHYATYCRSCVQKVPEIREKYYQKMEDKYGEKIPAKVPSIQHQIQSTMVERYGTSSYLGSDKHKNDQIEKNNLLRDGLYPNTFKIKDILHKIDDPGWLTEENKNKSLIQIATELNVSPSLIQKRFNLFDITVQQHFQSQPEREVCDFIASLGIEVQTRVKKFGPEVDVYLPEYSIAIEIDGVYWHSELNGKNRTYHISKTNMLNLHGIRLIHIIDVEWINKKDIVKSRILSLLNKNTEKIYARKCNIVNVNFSERRNFMNAYHIQGDVGSSYNIGLTFEDKLVSVMTFGKPRYGKEEYELIRFASKLNTTVVGGASKLFKHFILEKSPASVISYSDKRYNTGGVYLNLGFTLSHTSSPNYWYFHRNNPYQLYSRNVFQKHKLSEKLDLFDPLKTEWNNMINNGYDRIWDCGNDVWTWKP